MNPIEPATPPAGLPLRTLPTLLARTHLIGIGGAGMSGIARIVLARGGQVSGSDAKDSRTLLALRALGARVAVGHAAGNLDFLGADPTAIVTTKAVHQTDRTTPSCWKPPAAACRCCIARPCWRR